MQKWRIAHQITVWVIKYIEWLGRGSQWITLKCKRTLGCCNKTRWKIFGEDVCLCAMPVISWARQILRKKEFWSQIKLPLPCKSSFIWTVLITYEMHHGRFWLVTRIILCRGDGKIVGKVLVYKNPGKHWGDVHAFDAVWDERLNPYVGPGKYTIFFSVQGDRPVVDEIANSDLDGGLFWVCDNSEVLHKFTSQCVLKFHLFSFIFFPPSIEVNSYWIIQLQEIRSWKSWQWWLP